MQYSHYLQTDHWKRTRQDKLADKPVCQICEKDKSLHVHHKYYTTKTGQSLLFQENLSDLLVLCSSCHRLMHAYFGTSVQKINKKILRIKRLIDLGATKQMAFKIANQNDDVFSTVRDELLRHI